MIDDEARDIAVKAWVGRLTMVEDLADEFKMVT